ncbi:MAG: hypothetical protein U9Q67_00385 [Patescibacteria group bacterium]|nr:hypothetical protein [Patescibacteria group bacterium]
MSSSIEQLEKIALKALKKAYQVHQELGASGEKLIQKNQFGETALKVDIEAEKAVIDVFRDIKVPIRIISEEHGTTQIGKNPVYLGILDGLDGTCVYKKARGKGRYCTMLGIFSNLDPKYDDYIFSGVMEHSTRRLFCATKDNGSFIQVNEKTTQIKCSNCGKLDKNTKIYADENFDRVLNTTLIYDTFLSKLEKYTLLHEDASAVHYVDLGQGDADLVLECTRKGNLEIAIAYGLVTESKGAIVALDGTSLGPKRYLEFGQDKYLPVISASTIELAKELIKHLSEN